MDKATKKKRVKCPGHSRHWFTSYGLVGDQQDKCVRCGAPNRKFKLPPKPAA